MDLANRGRRWTVAQFNLTTRFAHNQITRQIRNPQWLRGRAGTFIILLPHHQHFELSRQYTRFEKEVNTWKTQIMKPFVKFMLRKLRGWIDQRSPHYHALTTHIKISSRLFWEPVSGSYDRDRCCISFFIRLCKVHCTGHKSNQIGAKYNTLWQYSKQTLWFNYLLILMLQILFKIQFQSFISMTFRGTF